MSSFEDLEEQLRKHEEMIEGLRSQTAMETIRDIMYEPLPPEIDRMLYMPQVEPEAPPPEPAKEFYLVLMQQIEQITRGLNDTQQRLVCHYNEAREVSTIRGAGYRSPDLVILQAEDRIILAHVNSLQLTLRIVTVEPDKKREFGFHTP